MPTSSGVATRTVYWGDWRGRNLNWMGARFTCGEYVGKENILWNSFGELVHLEGPEKGVFIPLGRWPGSLGLGLCGRVQLVATNWKIPYLHTQGLCTHARVPCDPHIVR